MALQDLPSLLMWPYWPPIMFNTNNVGTNLLMDAAAEWHAIVFLAPKTGTINQVHIRTNTVTTAQDLRFSLMNVDSDMKPDGIEDEFVVFASAGVTSNTFIASGVITSDGTGVGVKRSVTKGDKIALVYRFNSAVGSVNFSTGIAQDSTGGIIPDFLVSTTSGSTWVFQERAPSIALEYVTDGIVPLPEVFPFDTNTSQAIGSGSTPDEIGLKFQMPFKASVVGVYIGGSAFDVAVAIENAAKTVLAGPATLHNDTTLSQRRLFLFSTPVTLDVDTDYYVTWEPQSVTTRSFRYFTITDANFRKTLPNGVLSSWNERTDNGAWSENTLNVRPFALALESLSDDVGAAPTCNFAGLANGTRVKPLAGA